MPARMNCPVCGSDMRSRSLLAHYSWKPYRVCPDCQAKYTVDFRTKRRQVVVVPFALITFAFAAAGYLRGFPWSVVTLLAGIGLLIYAGYVLSKMRYVEFRERR